MSIYNLTNHFEEMPIISADMAALMMTSLAYAGTVANAREQNIDGWTAAHLAKEKIISYVLTGEILAYNVTVANGDQNEVIPHYQLNPKKVVIDAKVYTRDLARIFKLEGAVERITPQFIPTDNVSWIGRPEFISVKDTLQTIELVYQGACEHSIRGWLYRQLTRKRLWLVSIKSSLTSIAVGLNAPPAVVEHTFRVDSFGAAFTPGLQVADGIFSRPELADQQQELDVNYGFRLNELEAVFDMALTPYGRVVEPDLIGKSMTDETDQICFDKGRGLRTAKMVISILLSLLSANGKFYINGRLNKEGIASEIVKLMHEYGFSHTVGSRAITNLIRASLDEFPLKRNFKNSKS